MSELNGMWRAATKIIDEKNAEIERLRGFLTRDVRPLLAGSLSQGRPEDAGYALLAGVLGMLIAKIDDLCAADQPPAVRRTPLGYCTHDDSSWCTDECRPDKSSGSEQ